VRLRRTKKQKRKQAALLGVGLDNHDGHKRVTTGDKFLVVGGSEETHERLTETVVKTFEELRQRGKPLEEVEPTELTEIIHRSTPR
jgi:class 3 adenylate cyclase